MHRHVPPPVRPLEPRLRAAGLLAARLAGLVVLSAGLPAFAQQPPSPAAEPPDAAVAMQQSAPAAEPAPAEPAEGESAQAWDVGTPPGPFHEVSIDVTAGTWMNLDVSPDGREIAFDLLGDLYTVPIEGGEATALTSGFAWDMQPRYSPDGRSIAFTSDRAGGDNVWIVGRAGGDPAAPVQVTDEHFHLVNSPAWTPDGQFLAVRKHFVSQRSLGSGEIWLYHRSGSGGLQMTEKPNEQKDVGEPAFSPDGRYLYVSQDTTPGPVFEYNKDPNAGIYSVRRLDRESGEIVDWIGGPGGAVRPTPSPDGRRVAFVRRVRAESTLWLKDVASGAEWQVAGGLDRDMQETWAIHGVYPSMAWTPDSASIVYWAGGGIRRLDVATGTVSEIPFHVATTKKLTDALRFPVDVAPATFRARMLRWVEVSMDGSKVVFGALGRVWIQDLPDGTPRRLTRQDDPLEYFPSFSRDGKQVVYTSWDDDALGAVHVAAAVPGASASDRVVTSAPGHYVEPTFSPDGATIVFRKIGGGYLRSPTWSDEPGLYAVPSGGGEVRKLTDSGRDPHFGADPDRVYYLDDGEEAEDGPKKLLKSIGLDGRDEHTHAVSLNATEFRVSPDGKWLAWSELFNAYVAPLVATGRTVEIGPDSEALPVTKVSRDAGSYLHWSGDGAGRPLTLHWALGPQLFSRDLSDAFAFLAGAPATLPEPPAEGLDLDLEVASDVPSGALALEGGRVVTMAGAAGSEVEDNVIEDGVVIVEGNRITAVGRRGEVAVPASARRIDVSGKTLIPGIVDVHWHGAQGTDQIVPQQNWVDLASLAFGVTTLHDPSNDTSEVFTAAEMARAGMLLAPRIFSTGTILYGAYGDFKAVIDSYDDALGHLRRMQAVGAVSVKSYNQPRREQRQQVIQAARELGMMVVPEGGSLLAHNLTMVADGHTGVEHAIPVARAYDDVKQFWGASDVGYTPTLIVAYGGLFGENYWYDKTHVWEDERLLSFVPREIVDARSRRRITAPDDEWNHLASARTAAELHQAGVHVQLGAHGQREGLGAHWELWMLTQGGMSNLEALRAATLGGAWYLGMDHDLGSIEPGKLADVAILDGNPLEDIRQSKTVRYVLLNGRLYDAATLSQLAPEPSERPPLFWQKDPRDFAALAAGERP